MDDLPAPSSSPASSCSSRDWIVTFATESSAGIYLTLAAALVMIVGPALAKRDRRG